MDATEARTRLAGLRAQSGRISAAELDEIWAALEPVRPEDILGRWRGEGFDTGHPAYAKLERARWYGKTFVSPAEAKPLICRDERGELYSDTETGRGEASLWTVEFRGEHTATMVYDGQPIFDHFKRVDDGTLLGIMNGKGVPADGPFFYFLLERA